MTLLDPMSDSVWLLAQSGGNQYLLVYVLWMAAGLLGGGAWSTYKNGVPILALILGLCALVAAGGAVLWMIGMTP